MTRPVGEIRRAMDQAVDAISRERGPLVFEQGMTHTEMAQRAQVGFALAKSTARNMERDGALVRLGVRSAPGVNRGMVRYAPAAGFQAPGVVPLEDLLRSWARKR